MTIAVCNPNLHGDTLWSVAAARELARRHGCGADFWVTSRADKLKDLLEVQPFVRQVVIDRDSIYTGGNWCGEEHGPEGIIHHPLKAQDPRYGYEAVYELHMRDHGGESILDWFCRAVGLPRQGHWFDLPPGVPHCALPEVPFVVLASRPYEHQAWYDPIRQAMRELVAAHIAPVVEVGSPRADLPPVALDLGSINRTSDGFLEMAGIISKCKVFVGTTSAPLVLADAFPWVHRICLHGGGNLDRNAVTKSSMNHYLEQPTGKQLIEMVTWMLLT